MANKHADGTAYEVRLLSETGGLVLSGPGAVIGTEPLGEASEFDTILVAADIGIPKPSARSVVYLHEAARSARQLAGLCLGAFVLAEAGLLDRQNPGGTSPTRLAPCRPRRGAAHPRRAA